MFKYTLAATLDEMDREGITVAECPLRSMRCLSLQNGRIVGINTARFDFSAEELAARLRRGDTLADAAEYFCVTEDFLRKAYALYRDMGYSFGAEEKA